MKRAAKRMERTDWIKAAKRALIVGGVAEVKVDRLAKALNITRGSFYGFFESRAQLLDALLADWRVANTDPFLAVLQAATTPKAKFLAFTITWIDEKKFSPQYDSAVRDWARTSRKAARAVRAIDEKRIEALFAIFREFGYDEEDALVRARITYFHQVGYYTLRLKESRKRRYALLPRYYLALTGQQP